MSATTDTLTLLAIDDEKSIQQILEHYFKDSFTVITKSNGKDGLNWIQEGHIPHVIIADIQMPVMDGYQATRYISLHYPCIKILGMSANEEAGRQMLACGASFFLPKCVDGEKIAAAIHTLAGS